MGEPINRILEAIMWSDFERTMRHYGVYYYEVVSDRTRDCKLVLLVRTSKRFESISDAPFDVVVEKTKVEASTELLITINSERTSLTCASTDPFNNSVNSGYYTVVPASKWLSQSGHDSIEFINNRCALGYYISCHIIERFRERITKFKEFARGFVKDSYNAKVLDNVAKAWQIVFHLSKDEFLYLFGKIRLARNEDDTDELNDGKAYRTIRVALASHGINIERNDESNSIMCSLAKIALDPTLEEYLLNPFAKQLLKPY